MTTNQENTLLILRGDNFDRLFAKYYSYYDELHKAFHTPKFTVGDTNVPYRVINHWDQLGLLPAGFKKEGGWRLFSLVEMAWLQIILQMRKFGMSLDQIKKAKDGIVAWNEKSKSYPLLEFYLATAITTDLNVYAVIAQDGRGGLATDDEVVMFREFSDDSSDLLMISLKGIIKELGFSVVPVSTFVDDEPSLVSNLTGKVKEIKVEKKGPNMNEVETTEVHPADSIKDIQQRLRESNVFGEMTIKYENGKEQSAEVKIRKRIKR